MVLRAWVTECHLEDGSPRVLRKWLQWLLFIAFPNRPSYVADHTFSAFQPLPVALWVIVNMGQNTKKSTWTLEDRTFLGPSRMNFSKQIWYSLSTRWVLYKNIKSKIFLKNDLDGLPGTEKCERHLWDRYSKVSLRFLIWLILIFSPTRPSNLLKSIFSAFQTLPVALWVIVNWGQNAISHIRYLKIEPFGDLVEWIFENKFDIRSLLGEYYTILSTAKFFWKITWRVLGPWVTVSVTLEMATHEYLGNDSNGSFIYNFQLDQPMYQAIYFEPL